MNAILLDGYGDPYITFNDSRFPVTLRSSALIVPGNTYGVCATGPNGAIVQDDFATGKHVTATSDLLRINMLVTPQYLSFFESTGFTIYLQSMPASPS